MLLRWNSADKSTLRLTCALTASVLLAFIVGWPGSFIMPVFVCVLLSAGGPPSPINLPKGCRFASRCPMAEEGCRQSSPPLTDRGGGHRVACFLA